MSYHTDEVPEVAFAFREALEDLQRNDQYEIDNLTVIAKESTEHAQALCQELEAHIKKTRPEFKLPALYLLDSLVKNVGTPYTVYLSRNLYKTFFDAFTVVDANTRRAMEELFRSWKQPVPLSRDPRPVFPTEVTQPIDASLIKVRSVNLKARQEEEQARLQNGRMSHLPSRLSGNGPLRQTPTPTGGYSYQPPPVVGQNSNLNSQEIAAMMSGFQTDTTTKYPPAIRSPAPVNYPSPVRQGPVTQYPPNSHPQQNGTPLTYAYSGPPPPTMSHQQRLDKLRADVQGLIESAKAHLARNAYDADKQKLLSNLTSLKVLLDGGQLSLAHIQSTELVVASIAKDLPPLPPINAYQPPPQLAPGLIASLLAGSTPQPTPPQPYPPQQYVPPPQVSTPQFAPAVPTMAPQGGPPVSVAQMMALLNPSTPTPSSSTPATAPTSGNPLLDQLRASGLLGGTPSSSATPVPPPSFNFLNAPQPSATSFQQPNNDVKLDPASLKIKRPYLIQRLYGDKPDQCKQCGMRFPGTPEGKTAKGNHLDWHFKTNSRVADSMKSAVNRSWYIDEREWISYREQIDGISGRTEEEASAAGITGAILKRQPKEQFVPVPTDLTLAKQPCPICQEKFEVEWHKELEQPVWKDAIKVGPKYYHATCYAEVKGNTPVGNSARSTPDPVLGKRTFDHFKQDTPSHS